MTELRDIPLSLLDPSPFQIRSRIDPDGLNLLLESLKRDGQQRPIKVRPVGERYEIVFGHRMVSAANRDGWKTVQAVVENLTDEQVVWIQYAENEYREDLFDYDRANWLKLMIDGFGYNQKQLADKLGKDQPWVARHLAILKLKGIMSRDILYRISEFQARRILEAPQHSLLDVCERIEQRYSELKEIPSAREIEQIVKSFTVPRGTPEPESEETDEFMPEMPAEVSEDEAPALGPSPAVRPLQVDTDYEAPAISSAEEYVRDYFSRYLRPDEEYLAWDICRKYGLSDKDARKIIAYVKDERTREIPETRRAQPTQYEPTQAPTCRCPICGRDGADKMAILTNFVEDTAIAQMTLFDFLTEAFKR